MRNLILLLFFLQSLNIFSQKEIIKVVDSTFTVNYHILKIDNESFINEIASIVLEYGVHEKHRERVYVMQVQKDSLDNIYKIIVSYEPVNITSLLDSFSPFGIINIQKTPFFYCGDVSIVCKTNDVINFTRKKRLGYMTKNGFIKSDSNLYESPTWFFIYKNGKVELLRADSI